MHIVFLILNILKIAGIVLAILLGIVLALLLTILLVPLRYRINVDNLGDIHVRGKVCWLFHILTCRVVYEDGVFLYWVSLLGLTLRTNAENKKVKRHKVKKQKKRKEKKIKEDKKKVQTKDLDWRDMEKPQETTETIPPVAMSPEVDAGSNTGKHPNVITLSGEIIGSDVHSEKKKNNKKIKNKISFFSRLKQLILQIKNWWNSLFRKIRGMFTGIENVIGKIKQIYGFFSNEENKKGFAVLYHTAVRVLKHIRPTRIKGYVKYGTGDPYTTGCTLAAASIFYGCYGESVSIIPDFENEILETELFAKGRIRAGTLLIIIVKLILNGEFRNLTEEFKRLKEDL